MILPWNSKATKHMKKSERIMLASLERYRKYRYLRRLEKLYPKSSWELNAAKESIEGAMQARTEWRKPLSGTILVSSYLNLFKKPFNAWYCEPRNASQGRYQQPYTSSVQTKLHMLIFCTWECRNQTICRMCWSLGATDTETYGYIQAPGQMVTPQQSKSPGGHLHSDACCGYCRTKGCI